MALIELVKGFIGAIDAGPNTYHCSDCSRTFEVDAPPERVVCSSCGNSAVDVVSE